jgi:hypothetical protein
MYRRVKQSVTFILFVRNYVVKFKIDDFHCGKLYKKEIVWEVS